MKPSLARHAAKMSECERRFLSGEKRALIDAVYICVCTFPDPPVPKWVKVGLADAVGKVVGAHVASWDDVFGQPVAERAQRTEKKGLRAQRRHVSLKNLVWSFIWARRHAGASVNRSLYKAAAKELGCTQREVAELYSAAKKSGWKPPMSPDEQWRLMLELVDTPEPQSKLASGMVRKRSKMTGTPKR